jgi:hypothetical protein
VKRKEIKKTEPIRCIVDTANDPHEISLDENVTRENMHPADQFEAFKKLADERGFGAEEIAARFGVTPHVVRQRLRLSAVSPKLMEIYRNGDLALDQLMAFAITEDHSRQEAAFERLSYNRDASTIRRSPKPMSPPRIAARSLSAQKSIRRLVARSCATSSPRIAAAISRTWRFSTCWSWRNSGGRPTPSWRPRGGNGRKSSWTTPTATVCAGLIRNRSNCRRKIKQPWMPRSPNSTA